MRIVEAAWPDDRETVVAMFREYAASIDADICFQGFEQELAGLPGKYASPAGCVLLAFVNDALAGCGAIRPLGEGICEMKRLYVRPQFRGKGLGGILAGRVVADAKEIGYKRMRLDTVEPMMRRAVAMYRKLGFRQIAPYRENPIEGALYMELEL